MQEEKKEPSTVEAPKPLAPSAEPVPKLEANSAPTIDARKVLELAVSMLKEQGVKILYSQTKDYLMLGIAKTRAEKDADGKFRFVEVT